MRAEILAVGVLVCLAGVVLLATQGVILGVNIPKALGLPCVSGGNDSTPCPGFPSYSVGTIVFLAGLPILRQGLMTPATPTMPSFPAMPMTGAAGGMTPEQVAALMASSRARPVAPSGGEAPGRRYCPACGLANASEAAFCNRCGKPMPPEAPAATSAGPT